MHLSACKVKTRIEEFKTKHSSLSVTILIIVVVMIFSGCIYIIPPPDASPSEIVETFALWQGNENYEACYLLMSSEYKDSKDEISFKMEISQCDSTWSHYEFVEVKDGSEVINGNSAWVEIIYLKRINDPLLGDYNPLHSITQDRKCKTVQLVKENDGWRITDLHCELKAK